MELPPDAFRPRPQPYDPAYDPVHARDPGCNRDYAPTYWIATAGAPPEDDGPVTGDMDVDVAIVGSGYTGLSAAIHLAREHGIKAVVLEANRTAWGCSTRNGGQAQISAGRLKRSQWVEAWGVETALKLHREIAEGFDLFRSLIAELDVDVEPQDGGHLYIAHRARLMPALEAECRLMNGTFGYGARILSGADVKREHVGDREAAGALWEPDGIGVHAGKLAFGYQRLARRLGAKVMTASPVLDIVGRGSLQHLRTPGGTVRARRVAIATAGYTPPAMYRPTRHRLMPILSNSVVTRPLDESEIAACNFRTRMVLTDTRTLRHYYRLLPDNRVQIGSRSAVTGADAPNPKHLNLLLEGLFRKFPALRGIPLDYSWWGWVDVSHDMMPRIVQAEPDAPVFYAMGYGGNGVMYSAQAGRRLAQLVAGQALDLTLPIFASALPSHGLLTPFRRIGQRLMYQVYQRRDEAA
ncbi:FAD-binding oxidoreductase [Aureimonas altamirensis]|uniref:NAD(P)/FAD-dependent oxidoreductase n=1 Tax=Aureimonas altamirensis TaxID=370622 RepID=UPI0020373033|nr:FAD-binding oxidoreductase [Aureimonas altamirensis]MCM2502506.1 FAD-binding oxidoreductase [Aureimonas altamirensis]